MGKEEQKEEREVLDSIFPEEIIDVSETEYRVAIALDGAPAAEDAEEDVAPPTIILRVHYPDDYPDEPPELDLSSTPNAPKIRNLDIHADKARLLQSLQPTIEENKGMAMVFTLVSTLKENAEALMAERERGLQEEKEREYAKAEEEENRKFQGQAVTRESFLAWREKFRAEMEEVERRREEEREAEERRRRVGKEERKLTGRELWEKGLVGKDEEEDDEVDGAAVEVAKMRVGS